MDFYVGLFRACLFHEDYMIRTVHFRRCLTDFPEGVSPISGRVIRAFQSASLQLILWLGLLSDSLYPVHPETRLDIFIARPKI
jgi:hypothetical protein